MISEKVIEKSDPNVSSLAGLVNDPNTVLEDKQECLEVVHIKWKHKSKEKVVERSELIFQQKNKSKEVKLIIFGFILY